MVVEEVVKVVEEVVEEVVRVYALLTYMPISCLCPWSMPAAHLCVWVSMLISCLCPWSCLCPSHVYAHLMPCHLLCHRRRPLHLVRFRVRVRARVRVRDRPMV